jgi:ATP-dependent exoDNAse (exonuclease V) beta subunit
MSYARRVDSTQAALIRTARRLGAKVEVLGGKIDVLMLWHGRVLIVDWKGPHTRKTATQQRMTEQGWPVHYVRSEDELLALLTRRTI